MAWSKDEIDEERSCEESFTTPVVPELLKIRLEKNIDPPVSILERMGDIKTENGDQISVSNVAESRDLLSIKHPNSE